LAVGNTGGRSPAATDDYTTSAATGNLAANAVSIAGGNQPHSNLQPFLTVNFIIALTGIFPSRG
jgi:microcystin-dependent protein